MSSLEKRIKIIEKRNKRVELDKAWEVSLTRKLMVALLTYIVIVLFFYIAKLPTPLINAIVPTMGFLLSTLTVSYAKNVWISKQQKNK